MARVVLTDEAREDFRDLDGSTRRVVAKGLKKLEDEPAKRGEPLGAGKGGNLTTFRKLVVGDRAYRIVYRVEDDDDTVTVVWVIGPGSDDECYHLAVARLKLYSDPAKAALIQQLIDSAFGGRRG